VEGSGTAIALSANISETSINLIITVGREVNLNDGQIRYHSSQRRFDPSTTAADPEVLAKPKRRQFSAAYRLRILEEADGCRSPGEIGRLLRREGLYSSHLANWRKARRDGALRGLTSKRRGAKPKQRNPRSRYMVLSEHR